MMQAYIDRISKHLEISFEAYVVAFALIERYETRRHFDPHPLLDVFTLLLVSTRVATKFLDDQSYKNSYFAKIGGVDLKKFNHLEMVFLKEISYQLYVNEEVFHRLSFRLWRGICDAPRTPTQCAAMSPFSPPCVSPVSKKARTFGGESRVLATLKRRDEAKVREELAMIATSVASAVFDDDSVGPHSTRRVGICSPQSICGTALLS